MLPTAICCPLPSWTEEASACASNQIPATGEDDSQGRYNASIRGYALYDGYLYQFSGSSSVYLSVFDLEGNLQYCHRLENLPDVDYYMPASVSIADGKINISTSTNICNYILGDQEIYSSEDAIRMIAEGGYDSIDLDLAFWRLKEDPMAADNWREWLDRQIQTAQDVGLPMTQGHAHF